MYRLTFIFLVIVLLLFSCQQENSQSIGILTKENLSSEQFEINNLKDTTIITADKVKIFIPENSFETDFSEKIRLTFKAAFELEDIILGGLTTVTIKDEILESSGMFALEAVDKHGKILSLKPSSSLELTIPNVGVEEDLLLFDSEKDEFGRIKWKDPKELEVKGQLTRLEQGQQLFKENCASCHNRNLENDMTGPALGNVHLYRNQDWLIDFTRNSQEVIVRGDTLAICMFNTYNKAVMTSYPELSDDEIISIYDWIKNESLVRNVPKEAFRVEYDCDLGRILRRDSIINARMALGDRTWEYIGQSTEFKILYDKMSWANIDRFWHDPRMEEREFFVEVEDEFDQLEVYIVFPREKVFVPTNWNDGNKYSFTHNRREKMTTFPIGAEATILAIGKSGEEVYFQAKEIIYGDQDVVQLSPELSSSELVIDKIKEMF